MSGYSDIAKMESSRNCLRRIARHDEPQFSKHSIVNIMEKFVKTVNSMDDTILVPCRLMDRQVGDSTDIMPASGKDSTANQLSSHSHSKRNTSNSKNVHEFLNASELFNLYSMLNSLKNDLLWTGKDKVIEDEENNTQNIIYTESQVTEDIDSATTTATTLMRSESVTKTDVATSTPTTTTESAPANAATSTSVKGHVRRPSTASVASTASVSNVSDSESDSGMESDGNKCDNAQSSSSTDSLSSNSSESEIHAQKLANLDKATELAQRCRRHLNGLYHCLEQMTEAANYLTARYQSDIGGPA